MMILCRTNSLITKKSGLAVGCQIGAFANYFPAFDEV